MTEWLAPTQLPAQGPRCLPQVNKEAEHRERLQELQQRITAAQERIFSGGCLLLLPARLRNCYQFCWLAAQLQLLPLPLPLRSGTLYTCYTCCQQDTVGARNRPQLSAALLCAHLPLPLPACLPACLPAEEGFQADARKRQEELAVDVEEVRASAVPGLAWLSAAGGVPACLRIRALHCFLAAFWQITGSNVRIKRPRLPAPPPARRPCRCALSWRRSWSGAPPWTAPATTC